MKTSDNGRKFIESFEGLILEAYDDYNDRPVPVGGSARGTLTIGYGHTVSAGPPGIVPGETITKEQADQILASDLSKVETDVAQLVRTALNQNQFDALVSFEFNTGALRHSSGLNYLNQAEYEFAWNVFDQYTHAAGRVLPGLVRRRQAERNLFFTAPKFNPAPVPQTTGLWAAILRGLNALFTRKWNL